VISIWFLFFSYLYWLFPMIGFRGHGCEPPNSVEGSHLLN